MSYLISVACIREKPNSYRCLLLPAFWEMNIILARKDKKLKKKLNESLTKLYNRLLTSEEAATGVTLAQLKTLSCDNVVYLKSPTKALILRNREPIPNQSVFKQLWKDE